MEPTTLGVHADMSFWALFLQAGLFVKVIMLGLFAASVAVLDQLGWLDDAQRSQLQPWRATPLRNARGLEVGERQPVFQLRRP